MLTCEYPAGRQPGSDEQAKRDIRNMMNRVKRMRSRRGLPALRYIYITERTESAAYGVRWHHHVIMSGDGLTREEIDRLFAADAELADWGRRMAEEQLRRHEEYFADFAWRDKSEQYKRVLREYPQLLQRIALKDLAAYLFLTPQSLSRIRAEIK